MPNSGLLTLLPIDNANGGNPLGSMYVSTVGQLGSGPSFYDIQKVNDLYCEKISQNLLKSSLA